MSNTPPTHIRRAKPKTRIIRIGESSTNFSPSTDHPKRSIRILNNRFSEIISQKAEQLKEFREEKNDFYKDIQEQNNDLYKKYMSLTQQNNQNVMFIKKLTQELNKTHNPGP